MSKLKATPGPYRLLTDRNIEDPKWDYLPKGVDGFLITADDRDWDWCIAAVFNDGPPNAEGNAHLLAAAPEMYEALENAVNLVRIHTGPDDRTAQAAIAQAETALSRARGEGGEE